MGRTLLPLVALWTAWPERYAETHANRVVLNDNSCHPLLALDEEAQFCAQRNSSVAPFLLPNTMTAVSGKHRLKRAQIAAFTHFPLKPAQIALFR